MNLKKGLKNNMLEVINYINVYIASKKRLYGDLYLNPKNGDIYRECGNYQQRFREYIRNNKLYVVIDGIMYNKAKLIYDSVNKDNLPIGDYTIKVVQVPSGYNIPTNQTTTIKKNETSSLIFELEKGVGNLDVIVRDKDTKVAIPNAKVEIVTCFSINHDISFSSICFVHWISQFN